MADKLTIKQEKYAQGLFAGLTQREAYKQAYNADNMTDAVIDVKASELANSGKIKVRIDQLTQELAERNMVTKEKVLSELAHIAFDDISNYLRFYPDAEGNIKMEIKDSETIDTRAVSEVSIGKDGQFKFKVYCKDNALVQLGKHLGMFVDRVESNNTNTNIEVQLTEEERKQRIAELRKILEE